MIIYIDESIISIELFDYLWTDCFMVVNLNDLHQ